MLKGLPLPVGLDCNFESLTSKIFTIKLCRFMIKISQLDFYVTGGSLKEQPGWSLWHGFDSRAATFLIYVESNLSSEIVDNFLKFSFFSLYVIYFTNQTDRQADIVAQQQIGPCCRELWKEKSTYHVLFSNLHDSPPSDLAELLGLREEHFVFGGNQTSHAVVAVFFCNTSKRTLTNIDK